MEKINLGYSTKNIPIPSNKDHQRALIGSAYKHITAVRWRTFFFQNPNIPRNSKETYCSGSTKTAPVIPELKQYEDGLLTFDEYRDQKP